MTKDWKSNIGEYFSGKGTFRLDYIKDKIIKDCEEYLKYLDSFNGIRPGRPISRDIEDKSYDFVMKINLDKMGGRIYEAPFIMGIDVNDEGNFNIMYSVCYDWGKRYDWSNGIANLLKKNIDPKDLYHYEEEEITEPERLEKEWFFQLITERLINYIESFNQDHN